MTSRARRLLASAACAAALACIALADKPTPTGPATEKRFPPLTLPPGFKATLFTCDPMIEYPSAIAAGPRSESLFVAIDYLTGLGTGIERRDEVRLIEDTDGDGYADRSTVFASGLNSVQGLVYHGGTLFVMHAPYLSALRDTGKGVERRDLLVGLGLPPEKDQIRLHNANGVVAGHDGWLYLALGDRGCDIKRPEGDRLVLEGGGILRCRPDGRDLHVFSTGLRNIYDVALDEDLNAFVRDNENDGGDYKIRVCHSFFGADHGYPHHYYERPDEALPPLADLGLGSSAGGTCYLETAFPAEYRGNLLFCEWGRAVVRYPLRPSGSSFAPVKESDFAAGAPSDPYGFKPTDLVVDRDGSLFISDWADGQRPRRGRGRIYRIRYPDGKPAPKAGLDSESHFERCRAQQDIEIRGKDGLAAVTEALKENRLGVRGRLHAVWVMAKLGGREATEQLLALAKSDPDPRVQAQALRAVADLADPVLVRHRLDAGAGDAALAQRIADLAVKQEPRVKREAVIALGRLRWPGSPAWLRRNLDKPDAALAHAAEWAMRQSGNWDGVLKLLDEKEAGPLRDIARRAAAERYESRLVDGLIERLKSETDSSRRLEYADMLTRIWKKPAAWTYWGFRPGPRPANSVAWERTAAVEQALERELADPRPERLDVLRRMLREQVPARTVVLGNWIEGEKQADTVAVLLAALRDRPAGEARAHLEKVLRDRRQTPANRLLAVSLFLQGLAGAEERLLASAEAVEDGPVLAELLRAAGTQRARAALPLLLRKLGSEKPEVRAGAVEALAALGSREAHEPIRKLLDDSEPRVRAAAALAAGKLRIEQTAEALLKLARDADAAVRRSSLEALRRLREQRALPVAVAALADPETVLPALACVGDLGGPAQAPAVAAVVRGQPSAEVLAAVGKVLTGWSSQPGLEPPGRLAIEQALADVHGSSGVLLAWHIHGPVKPDVTAELVKQLNAGRSLPTGKEPAPGWRIVPGAGIDSRARLGIASPGEAWLAYGDASVAEAGTVDFFAAGPGLITVWLNGKEVHRRQRPGVVGPYPDRFETALVKGRNTVLVQVTGAQGDVDLQLRFRRKSATPERERLAKASLARAGNPAAGRQLFLNAEKTLCIKCHRVGDQGERIGPELTGLGGRFSKVYIVESVLEPSRSISPSFETLAITLTSGKGYTGVKVAETTTTLTIADQEGRKHVLAKAEIESQVRQPLSTMPEGLEKRLTEDEFVDLISYLVNLKGPSPKP